MKIKTLSKHDYINHGGTIDYGCITLRDNNGYGIFRIVLQSLNKVIEFDKHEGEKGNYFMLKNGDGWILEDSLLYEIVEDV